MSQELHAQSPSVPDPPLPDNPYITPVTQDSIYRVARGLFEEQKLHDFQLSDVKLSNLILSQNPGSAPIHHYIILSTYRKIVGEKETQRPGIETSRLEEFINAVAQALLDEQKRSNSNLSLATLVDIIIANSNQGRFAAIYQALVLEKYHTLAEDQGIHTPKTPYTTMIDTIAAGLVKERRKYRFRRSKPEIGNLILKHDKQDPTLGPIHQIIVYQAYDELVKLRREKARAEWERIRTVIKGM